MSVGGFQPCPDEPPNRDAALIVIQIENTMRADSAPAAITAKPSSRMRSKQRAILNARTMRMDSAISAINVLGGLRSQRLFASSVWQHAIQIGDGTAMVSAPSATSNVGEALYRL